MEPDCISGLYHSLGLSVGAEFSCEDVTLLYRRAFHVPCSAVEACAAMQKVAGGDDSWSCVGANVLDVLCEMERERKQKEKLFWDLQLGAHNQSECEESRTSDTDNAQRQRLLGKKDPCESLTAVKRLKKSARHCWARLASEGVQSILLPTRWQGQCPEVRAHAWGCVGLSDVLLLVDVKYDLVTRWLYREMLQEHYTLSKWENMLPWQQQKEEEELEDLAEEALESRDMFGLAELPGAFGMYSLCTRASSRNCSEPGELCWSAISLLCDIHTCRHQEKDTLLMLADRLDRESLSLLCLYIRLATLRAQREKTSYSALLAAQQSWETWPHVKSPSRAEQAVLWLRGEGEEQKAGVTSVSPHQGLLQLLVLTQEQERKHLLNLLRGVSLKDLQEPDSSLPLKQDFQEHVALRNSCIKKLRQIHASLQTHNRTNVEQMQPHLQIQAQTSSDLWLQHQLEDVSLILLTNLSEVQEVQASVMLSTPTDKSAECIRTLRDEYESGLQNQCCSNTLQVLFSDAPLTPGSVVTPNSTLIEDSSDQSAAQSSCGELAETPTINPIRGPSTELNGVQTEDRTKENICAGCGEVTEVLPYLEVLCVSDATEEGVQEENMITTKTPQNCENQGSLITLAWGKPLDDTNYEKEAAGKSHNVLSSLENQLHQIGSTGEAENMFIGCVEEQCADQRRSAFTQMGEGEMAGGQPEKREDTSGCDLPLYPLIAETLQAVQPGVFVEWRAGELCSGLNTETINVEKEGVEVEMWPTGAEPELGDLRGPDPVHTKDLKYNSQAEQVDCYPPEKEYKPAEREQIREGMSAMEREKTMRSLVDMQRKVEQRQQRDRQRQLLRVQERLLIIQNRKAEEDLLGLNRTDRLRHLTQDLPQEDKNQQKTAVRERLEQLRRERSTVMQSKRDRNTAGFKELLGPVALYSSENDDGTD